MRQFLVLGVTVVIAAAFAASAAGDAVYHTERLTLSSATAQGGGMVVNVHPNGPNVYAHEIYQLRDAVPGTYQVFLNIFPGSLDCTGSSSALPTAQLVTNSVGTGQADAKLTPEDVAALRGMTFSINWTVTGPATYVTRCTVVTLD